MEFNSLASGDDYIFYDSAFDATASLTDDGPSNCAMIVLRNNVETGHANRSFILRST